MIRFIISILFIFCAYDCAAQDNIFIKKDSSISKPSKKQNFSDTAFLRKYRPSVAIKRSAMLPGWGQYTNKKYWKIPLVYAGIGIPAYLYFRNIKQYRFEGSFEGWVRKIMVYCSIKHFRTKSNMHPLINIESVDAKQMDNEDIIARLGKKELLKMIQALPPVYRMIFNLYVFEGLKHREIAAQLGLSEGTSKSNFFDAKVILQRAVNNSLKISIQKF